jgi:calcineurin-like phosphoesterase family protein
MKLFFTSDEHLGHRNIIEYVKRPYRDTDEEARDFIARHNAKVGREDMTWHLGDMFWSTFGVGPAMGYLTALNGAHAIIPGNHDELVDENPDVFRHMFTEIVGSGSRPGSAYISVPNMKKQKLVLSHYAHRIWRDSHKGSWHLYGHSHAEAAEHGLSFDVGVDNPICNFAPMSMDEVIVEMSKRKQAHVITNVGPGKAESQLDHLPEGSH